MKLSFLKMKRHKDPSRIKVLMFGWEFPPHNSGGLGVACLGLARALVNQGVEIVFVLPRPVDVNCDFLKIIFAKTGKIEFRKVDSPLCAYVTSSDYKKNFVPGKGKYGATLIEEVERYGMAARLIAESEEFDVIHAHDWLSFLAGVQAKDVSGKPLVTHVHATEFDRTGGNGVNQDVYEIERRGMHASDSVIAVSNFTKNIVTGRYGVDSNKVNVVHNGVEEFASNSLDNSILSLKERNKIVLFVGRLTLQKGPDYFIKMAKKVLEHEKDVVFLVTGEGDMKLKLIQEAASLGIADKVIFTGFLRGEQLKKVYKAADLVVMPSVSEPFGITALEALFNGTPVLISKQSGVSEVVFHALKTDFWDVDEMTNKVVSFLRHDGLKNTLKTNGYTEVQKTSWEEAAKKTKTIYKKLLYK